ncbi:uncharacterized protein L201_000089 [Kwoniella dendrophila CBS 6074]|uniref:Uncharacterized protein n=1 Tax=Kwoniella dendrophila CBS 6074 TaxID=1295534 RepID=A0AAX4JKQ8_9TREE
MAETTSSKYTGTGTGTSTKTGTPSYQKSVDAHSAAWKGFQSNSASSTAIYGSKPSTQKVRLLRKATFSLESDDE